MMPLHGLGMSYTEMYEQDLQAILHADRLGYDEVFVGEHYSAKVEPISDSLQFMSVALPQTGRITFGTGVLNLPHHHPAKVAADVALFDHMSRGRFIMGIGPGGLASDFELFKTTDKDRGRMMVECIEMVHRIWESEPPYRIGGQFWDVTVAETVQDDLGIGPIPKPYQKPHPPIAVSAMSPGSGMARLAGERGWSCISANFNPLAHTQTHWEAFAAGAESAGRRPDRGQWRVARSILVTETDGQAADYLADPSSSVHGYYTYLRTQLGRAGMVRIFKDDPAMSDEACTVAHCIDKMVIAGSPRTVTEKLAAVIEATGGFGTLEATFHEWDDPAMWRRSMELLATEVMPSLRRKQAAVA
jgi:alkanesulfonate monooxygenase SsuD/methylene tetrahydromethanopterin reductase-like flavin-dependent oxidoreductase (luciferase family)